VYVLVNHVFAQHIGDGRLVVRTMPLGAEPRDQLRCDCLCGVNKRSSTDIFEVRWFALLIRGALPALLFGRGTALGCGLRI
jgi:hypothetical protein